MFSLKSKKNKEKNLIVDSNSDNRIEQLHETIERQKKELSHLRYLSEKADSLARQEKDLADLIKTYKKLCEGARESKKKYDELNKEMIMTMRQYRNDMKKM